MESEKLHVARWAGWQETSKLPRSIDESGGWFDLGNRWQDYYKRVFDSNNEHIQALRKSVLDKQIRRSGEWHERSSEGTPIFSDGTTADFTWRAWGDFMAAVWSTADNKDYHYMDFYCGD